MSSTKLLALSAAIAVFPMLTGCTAGYVYDANTKQTLPGVIVVAGAECQGSGCQSATSATAISNSGGVWDFDGYGNENGTNDVQMLSPLAGHKTLNLTFIGPGYVPLGVFHQQEFKPYTSNGNTYQVDLSNPIYLCPILGAPDSDGDGLCDAAEASYGTNPNLADSDGDGIDDRTELFGISNTSVGGTAYGLDLANMFGAKPNHKDIYVYYNYYVAPNAAALQQVVTAFANAPVSNPDGTTGITLHLYGGIQIAAADQVANFANVPGDWSQFDVIKNKYMPASFTPFMHYALFANSWGTTGSSGLSRGIPAHDFMVTLGGGGSQQQQAGTFMHEFGHNLGLQHGGNEGNNCKPNYLSIMNYMWQQNGLQTTAASGVLDYSRFVIESVNEGSLVETSGMKVDSTAGSVVSSTYQTRVGTSGCWNPATGSGTGSSNVVAGTIQASIDWNSDGKYESTSEALDLDGDPTGLKNKTFNKSQNDWAALAYTGNASGGGTISGSKPGANSVHAPFVVHPAPQIVAPEAMTQELSR